MGLFGGSKTYVGTSVSRVLKENQYPNTLGTAVIGSIMEGGHIADRILEDSLNGPALKVERYYKYAKEHYPYGLPNQSYINTGTNATAAKGYIRSLYSGELRFEYLRLEGLDLTHVGWQRLTEDYDYDFDSNEIRSLTDQLGHKVYLDNMVAYHYLPPAVEEEVEPYDYGIRPSFSPSPTRGYTPERRAQDIREIQMQAMHSDYKIIDSGEDHVRVFYVYEVDGEVVRDHFNIYLTDFDEDASYYHGLFYESTTSGDITHFFTYRHGAGTHPTLDNLNNANYVSSGHYFPFLFFRKHNQNLAAESEHGTDRYKASVKMAEYLNLDFQEFSDAIHENPDIDDVRHAVLMMAVPANSNDPYEIKYLFDFFNRIHVQDRDGGDVGDLFGNITGFRNALSVVPKATIIQDAGFKMALGMTYLSKRTRVGKLGPIGTYKRVQGSQQFKPVSNEFDDDGNLVGTKTRTYTLPYQRYQKQSTPFTYEEITVYGLTLRYDVYKNYNVVADAHDSKLLIPIDKDITDTYSLLEKEAIYFRSLHMVYNSKVKKKTKWYQSGFFKFAMIVVAVVVTAFTGGQGASLIAAAIGLGLYTLAIAMIVVLVAAIALKSYVFRLVVKEVGLEAAFVIAVTAAALGAGMGLSNNAPGYMPTATTLLNVSTNLTNAMQHHTKVLLNKYDGEAQSFELLKEEKIQELEEAMALLETNDFLDPFMFIGEEPLTVFGEDPNDFYNRTVHSGNIGTVIFQTVESFVDISLTLPKINDTVGDTIYV